MRDDEYDDRDDDRRDDYDRSPRFPGIVRAAGVIWIVVGGIGLINTVINLAALGAQGAGPRNPGQGPGAVCGGLVALAFLIVGYQTVTGKARDTLGNGIGSLVLAALQFGLAALMLVGAAAAGQVAGEIKKDPNAPQLDKEQIRAAALLAGGLIGFIALLLTTAGILALSGRSAYQAWRRAEGLDRPKRRPRDDEYDDLDDRPRRRRDADDDDRR